MIRTTLQFILLTLTSLMVSSAIAMAQATATVDQTNTNFNYTVCNNAPTNSVEYLISFQLLVNAPVSVVGSPTGWEYCTDNSTYINWFCTDTAIPFTHAILPGKTLAGFSIVSMVTNSSAGAFVLSTWNIATSNSDVEYQATVPSPYISSVIPIYTVPTITTNSNLQFTLIGAPTHSYVVETSSNLSNWNPMITNTSPFDVVATNVATSKQGFFWSYFVTNQQNGLFDD
jgi:hypothetical protein